MKKALLFALAVLFTTAMMAQNRTMILQESFDGSGMPFGWSVAGMGLSNWSVTATANAGGVPNEVQLNWSPEFDGLSRLVTPAVNLSGIQSVVVSFKHSLDNYSGTTRLGVATSSDDGATWNEGWSQNFSSTTTQTLVQEIITPDMGQSSVRFCIFFEGNSYNINYWYFDDVEIYTLENLDLAVTQLNFPSFIGAGTITPAMSISNKGVTAVTSVEASYQVNDDEPVVETFALDLASLNETDVQFSMPVSLMPGSYNITLTILNVNGTVDDNPDNNSMSKSVSIALGSAQRIPMIEHFSSSTCGPCVSVNQAMLNLTNNNPGKYTYTKYPMSWPGSGDPYYTDEGGVRRNYYGCNAVPETFLDGVDQGYSAVSQANLDANYNTPAFADIRGSFTTNGTNIHIIVDLMSYIELSNVRTYVSVNEKTTTGNVGSNGETSFHHIMMKMLPDAQGTTMSISSGEIQRLEFDYDMASTHVEEMDDLEVSVWLQDHSSKEIFNSHFMFETADHPYPVENLTLVEDESGEENLMVLAWEAPEQGCPLGYDVFVNGELMVENVTNLEYSFAAELGDMYIAEVQAKYADDVTSVKAVVSKQNTWAVAESHVQSCRLYPNPASNMVRIDAESEMQQVEVYDVLGNLMERVNVSGKSADINLNGYCNGVYFVNVIQAESISTQRLVIAH